MFHDVFIDCAQAVACRRESLEGGSMSDTVRAEKIAHEVDYAARQLAQAGRLDLTHEFIQHAT